MQIITFDAETFYSKDFSLSKMTTESYIRDSQYETIGVGVKVNDQPAQWFSGDHQQIHLWLSQFDWDNAILVAHNAMFDAAILSWRFGIRPKLIADTMSMARPLYGQSHSLSLAKLSELLLPGRKGDEVTAALGKRRGDFTPQDLAQYGEYCKNDCDLTYQLFKLLWPCLPNAEKLLIDWTMRCFTEPVLRVNVPLLKQALKEHLDRRDTLLENCGVRDIGELRSDIRVAELLMDLGVQPPTKISKATGEEVWAFSKQDVEFMDLVDEGDERVVALVEARLGSKTSQVETRLNRFICIGERGAMPFPLSYAGAMTTFRFAGTDSINMQNLPSGRDEVSPLRKAIEAPPGFLLLAADLSSIELRMNCWQSGQWDVLKALENGEDVYANSAAATFGYPLTKRTHPLERFVGKTQELSCGYQCGHERFRNALRVAARRDKMTLPDDSPEFAKKAVYGYRDSHKEIVAFWKLADAAIPYLAAQAPYQLGPYHCRDGKVYLPNGMALQYPNLRQDREANRGFIEWVYDRRRGRGIQTTNLYGGKLVENVTQAAARIVMTDAMLRINPVYRIVGTVHDEIICVIPENCDHAQAIAFVREQLTTSPVWAPTLPLACDIKIGKNYADCK